MPIEPHRLPADPHGTPANLADLLRARAAAAPDALALVEPGPNRSVHSWSALDARADAVAAGLGTAGLVAGQRLALLGANSAAFVVAYLAALRAGVVVVPVNPQSSADEVAVIVADSGARLLLTDDSGLVPRGVRSLPLSATGLDQLAAPLAVPVASPQDPESLAVLLYTAGTSGHPKAAMLTHRALLAHVAQLQRLRVPAPHDTVLALLPLFHVWPERGARQLAGLGGTAGGGAGLPRRRPGRPGRGRAGDEPPAGATDPAPAARRGRPRGPGEVVIRGDNLFSGYWPDGAGGPDADGWFGTGDIGYLEDGELFLVDRARELVIVHGFNVYPAEVEQVILELDEVEAVAVVGRADSRSGEQVVAYVQGRAATPGRVAEHCARRLARFKRPAEVAVLPDLPRGATGKIRKGELRALATQQRERS